MFDWTTKPVARDSHPLQQSEKIGYYLRHIIDIFQFVDISNFCATHNFQENVELLFYVSAM